MDGTDGAYYADQRPQILLKTSYSMPDNYMHVNRRDCTYVANCVSRRYSVWDGNNWLSTIRDLMLAGFCLLLMVSPLSADEPIFKPTGRYVIDSPADLSAAKDSQQPSTDLADSKAAGVSSRREWYLVSESWCALCPAAKKRFLAKGWPERNVLTIAQCKARFNFTPDHVPFEFGEPQKQTVAVRSSIYNGRPGNSHESRETLIAHLLNDGIHKGRHTAASLESMSDEQLDALHNQDHGTQAQSVQPAVIRQQPVRLVPNTRRRGFLFWR